MTLRLSLALLCCAAAAQDFSNLQVEKVAGGYRFTEGPVWSRDNFLLFSDVPNDRIWKLAPNEPAVVAREKSHGANGNTFDAQGRLYSCESKSRRVTRMDKKGNVEVLAEKWEGKRLNAPNDIVVRRDGHVWFTDPAFGEQTDGRELDFYGIYHITPKGELKLVARPKGRPNGIALSPNGRVLYVAISDDRTILAFDVDRAGEASNERIAVRNIDGPPDGIRADEKGNIWVAANELAVYTPQGKLAGSLKLPEVPRNCAFGDADFATLYVTAMTSVYRVRVDVKGAIPY